MLELRGVVKKFGSVAALDGIDLAVQRGEFVTLLGPSGSGKTTLLRIIVGFESPDSGEVLLRGREISTASPAERGVGMVFQHYALFPHMSVSENIGYGLKLRKWEGERRRQRVADLLELLQLSGMGDRLPRELSGGQQQRVALGRALAYDPEIILMDEPLGALDRTLRMEMESEIRRIHRDLNATIVYVTHDQEEALALSDRIAIMRAGEIVGLGDPEGLYYSPPNSFVARFFSDANLIPAELIGLPSDGEAKVRCLGGEYSSRTVTRPEGEVAIAVRPRSLSMEGTSDDLVLSGTVQGTLLFGDVREITLDVPSVGSVTAAIDARSSHGIEIGDDLSFWVPPSETVVVELE